jgi:hypothetical protein
LKKWIANVTWQRRTLKVCTKHIRKGHAQAFFPSQMFFGFAKPYHKNDPFQWAFLEDLTAEAIGVETMWEGCFPSKHQLINEMLPVLVTKPWEICEPNTC